ncbi:thiamine phosphate synthase [Alloscardovia omnicolens]|uniref:thiamine phosphate synthase n=1 Tax=Alloscardovia omnicolens TaxID=419015 RepID=UPI0007640ABC|nr:thiamine phosphate synthase [Alloscardovia omnicolens]KWZ72340.1 thiamine-phosphate diphosphorylase [Alloscardovia omnicolens]MDK6249412.1 thiamine phosphate synthase [Alloscardovia omnicolens]MDK8073194.1 thiamine phosphate synthase [Alloscardovia omnicolens]
MKFDNRKQAVKDMMLLYGVTDRTWSSNYPLIQRITEALDNGMTCVQLREKHMSDEDFLSEAREVSALCKHYNVPFIINDNVDVAIACGADGIHVGQSDEAATQVRARVGSSMIVGVSTSSLEEAIKAEKDGADYVGVGAVFSTSTKADADYLSMDELRAICETVNIPTVAIGGIHAGNIQLLQGTGIDGVAVVSAIFGADDSAAATAQLRALAEKVVPEHA